MVYSIYETISSNQAFPVNIFVAPIESSTFHWHKEYEMIGILKGSINIRVESDSITLTKGDIFLVNSRVIHAIRCMEDEPNLCMILQMSPELFTDADSQEGVPGFIWTVHKKRRNRNVVSSTFSENWRLLYGRL